jgi:hypothetical protein
MVRVTSTGSGGRASAGKLLFPSNSSGMSPRDLFMMVLGATVAWLVSAACSSSSSLSSSSSFSLESKYEILSSEPPGVKATTSINNDDEAGWKSIHVFYGDRRHLTNAIPNTFWLHERPETHPITGTWFSQHGQDVAVQTVLNFKQSGFFVDLAANDAVWASNTFALESNFNWRGICIEANPFYWYRLSFRPNCSIVGAIAGKENMEDVQVTLGHQKGSGPLGGIVGSDFDNKKSKHAEHRFTVKLQTILQKWDAPKVIDYLSLDVEGAETFIMKDFSWSEYTFLCLTIERPSDELQGILTANGYYKVFDIKRGDTLWVHSSIRDQAVANLAKNPDDIKNHAVQDFPPGTKPM